VNQAATESTAVIIAPSIDDAMKSVTLAQDAAASLRNAFSPHYQNLHTLAERAKLVKSDEPKKARTLRLEMREVRVAADKTREECKADSLRLGKAIQGIYNVLEFQCVPMEKALEQIEKAEEIKEVNRKHALGLDRADQLRPFMDPIGIALGDMPEAQWAALLSGAKATLEAKLAAAAKAEVDRIAKEESDRAERERMRSENERLAKLAAEERAKREAQEAHAAEERAKADKLAAEERAKREAQEAHAAKERAIEQEKAAKALAVAVAERKKLEAKAAEERAKADKLAAEERAKREAVEAELAKVAKEKADKLAADMAAEKKAAAAPDKAKLSAFALAVGKLEVPSIADKELREKIEAQRDKFAAWVMLCADKI